MCIRFSGVILFRLIRVAFFVLFFFFFFLFVCLFVCFVF